MRQMTLAVDFDRVLHDTDNPVMGRRMGAPMEGAVASMWALRRRGYRLVVFTTNRIAPVTDWLDYYQVAYDDVTNTKPDADIYIDDKALRHVNWTDTMIAIGRLERGL